MDLLVSQACQVSRDLKDTRDTMTCGVFLTLKIVVTTQNVSQYKTKIFYIHPQPTLINSLHIFLYFLVVHTQCPQGCPNGVKGVKGETGPTGPRGYPGSTGPTGFAGPRGPRGYTGLPGYPGDEGSAGFSGNRGPRGHRGLPGDPGLVGPSGPPGPSDSCPEFDGVDFNEVRVCLQLYTLCWCVKLVDLYAWVVH